MLVEKPSFQISTYSFQLEIESQTWLNAALAEDGTPASEYAGNFSAADLQLLKLTIESTILVNQLATNPAVPLWHDFYEMCKPRVVMLMLLTSLVGMFLAVPGMLPLDILIFGNLGIALVASSGAVVNHLIDRKIDLVMKRTHNRPVAQGRVEPRIAALFATVIGVVGMAILLFLVNPLCAWLTLASFVGYAFIYTGYLKHATPQNIVIGGLSGAMPPLLGWSAVTGSIEADALILVLIIFAWTPPHFWALAIHRKEEYAKSGVPMLPVTHGEHVTKIHILIYTVVLMLVSIFPYFSGMSGMLYLVSALLLGAGFMVWSSLLMFRPKPTTAMDTFRYSIVYLALLFLALMVDHYLF